MAGNPLPAPRRATTVASVMPELVVVGGVSIDQIRTAAGVEATTVGGAGLYAALGAATRVRVGLVGVCAKEALAAGRWWRNLIDDAGLAPTRRLRFDISYDRDWRATYLIDDAQAEEHISYAAVPEGFKTAAGFHLCPTGSPGTQLAIAQVLRADPLTTMATVSATTFRHRIRQDPSAVGALWRLVDAFVCNAEEARQLTATTSLADAVDLIAAEHRWGMLGRCSLTCVTNGGLGCELVTAEGRQRVPAYPATVVDPTGAGESFAGALAAARLRGADWDNAARYASAVASTTVEGIGPQALGGADGRDLARRVGTLAGG